MNKKIAFRINSCKKSEWLDGLLFAEYVTGLGWELETYDAGIIVWRNRLRLPDDQLESVVGSVEWIEGIKDYYKNRIERAS
ncbi:MAG: hypothetical protein EOO06_00820 [Chitinophagaceae bacterium]|nr:MAG: hypothetical protein EOO06_00820 [Chitinophagaceae bacterium]